MRSHLIVALACVLITGCGGGGSSSGGTSPLLPTGPNGITGSGGPSPAPPNGPPSNGGGNASALRLLIGGAAFVQWNSQSTLGVLGTIGFSCPTALNVIFAMTPDLNRVYAVGGGRSNTIANKGVIEFDGSNFSVRRTIRVGSVDTISVAVTPDDSKLYVMTNTVLPQPPGKDSVEVIDVASGAVIKTIQLPTSSAFAQMAVDHSGAHVYVYADNNSNFVSGGGPPTLMRINTSDDSLAYSIAIPNATIIDLFLQGALSVTADDQTVNLSATILTIPNQNRVFAIEAASGSIVASSDAFMGILDAAKTGSTLYVVEAATGHQVLTVDPRTLAVQKMVSFTGIFDVLTAAAGSSGDVFIGGDTNAKGIIEAVDPSTGNVLQSASVPTEIFQVFAQ